MAPKYPAIPEPTVDPASLRDAVMSLKQAFEILSGQRGGGQDSALNPADLTNAVDTVNDAIDSVDGAKVNRSGDTMWGNLTIDKIWSTLVLNKPASGTAVNISGYTAYNQRWLLRPGNDSPESGTQTGSDFDIHSYKNDGSYIRQNLYISRDTGTWNVGGAMIANGNVYSNSSSATIGTYYFGSNGTKYIQYDGSSRFKINGGPADFSQEVTAAGGFWAQNSASTGFYYFGTDGTRYLQYDGSNYIFATASVWGSFWAHSTYGGAALTIREDGSGWTKPIRVNTSGTLEFINSAFNAVVMTMTDGGYLTANGVRANGDVVVSYGSNAGTIRFGQAGSGFYLTCDSANYHFGANCTVNAYNFTAANALASGGSVSGTYVTSSGNVNAGNDVTCAHEVTVSSYLGMNVTGYTGTNPYQTNLNTCNPNWSSIVQMGLHYPGVWAGIRWNGSGNSFDFHLNDSSAHKTSGSAGWVIDSDERVKNVKAEYTQGLDAVAALRPVSYTYKRNQSYSSPEIDPLIAPEVPPSLLADPETLVYVGLIAQEAEVTMPELISKASGYIDGMPVDDLRSAEYTPLIFALVNAVKELKARVEELEAR